MGGVHLRATKYLDHIAPLVAYGSGHIGGANLGALGIYEQGQVGRHLARVAYYRTDAIGGGVGGIHTYYIHAGKEQLTQKVYVAPPVAY